MDKRVSKLGSGEEARQKAHHEDVYRDLRSGELLPYPPNDWTRFDLVDRASDPYTASVKCLGDVMGRSVVDLGCGDGWYSVILAKRGARVWGCDISEEAVATAKERARVNGVSDRCTFDVCSAYELPYAEGSFDLAVGQAILHHLEDKHRTAAAISRVLKPKGRGVFSEPFGNSLWLERFRLLIPIPSESHDPEEWKMQFKYVDLKPFEMYFNVEVEEWQFLSRLDRIFKSQRAQAFLNKLDIQLLARCRWLRPYARTVIVKLTKR